MLEEADRAGFNFRITDGYRSIADQARLHSQNASNAAAPGRSNHQQGMAIDLAFSNGASVTYGSAASNWLLANAPRFGLHNLKGEAWHYSVDGH
jgi:LAS superfamily LD-carboxypeptidase LdcB